ncbi:hypothetical protein, partial [uncultured Thiodictyon sp.]
SYLRGSTATKRFKMHEPLADARAAKNGIRDERRVFCQALVKPFVVSCELVEQSNHGRLNFSRLRISRSPFDKLRANGKPLT